MKKLYLPPPLTFFHWSLTPLCQSVGYVVGPGWAALDWGISPAGDGTYVVSWPLQLFDVKSISASSR